MAGAARRSGRLRHIVLVACLVLASIAGARTAAAQAGTILDDSIPPGANFAIAQFRFWMPPVTGPVRGVLVLVPGSNGDGRDMAQDTVWQHFAAKQNLAIVACRFTDKPHDQGFIEEYIAVSKGTGDALQQALLGFAGKTGHPEIGSAPFLLWGMSAGGQFNWEYVAWKPERVIAFVVNKGGIYYSALLSKAARDVPGLLFTGGKDLAFRTNTINGLFAVNRRGGALWALTNEPGAGHIVGRSRDMAIAFYEDVLTLRLPRAGGPLATLSEKSGWLGDLSAMTVAALGDGRVPNLPTAWLPTERTARMWQAIVTEKEFPK